MFCPNCGTRNEDEARFCSKCGSPLGDAMKVLGMEGGVPEGPNAAERAAGDGFATGVDSPSAPPAAGQRGAALSAAAGMLGDKRKLVGIAAAVVVAIVAALLWFNLSGAGTLGQTSGTFKTAFESSDTVRKGIASNDYVNETPYSVTSFECTDMKKTADYEVTAHVKAVIENESFKTEITAFATYIDGTKLPGGYARAGGYADGYKFDITGSTTTPKKGIDKDSVNIAQAFESTLSDDGTTCTATVAETEQTWFVDAQFNTVHTYRFSDNRWTYVGAEATAAYDYHDIEGTYLPKGNSEVAFTIRDFDSEKGTFVVDYTSTENNAVYNYNVAGTLNADIAATARQDYMSKSTRGTYEFAGTGTCSGGDGQASVEGTLVVTDSGEAALNVSDLSIDYTASNGRNAGRSRSGMLFKQ